MARGRKHSLATRRKMSLAQKGRSNSFFGRRHSTKTKKKISARISGKNNPMFGRRHSEETKRKIGLLARMRSRRR